MPRMYLQTSRLQYNLQCVGVFQKAHSDKIFKPRLVDTLYHKNVNSSSKKHIFEPQKRFGQSDFKTAFVELLWVRIKRLKTAPTCHGDRCLDKPEKL